MTGIRNYKIEDIIRTLRISSSKEEDFHINAISIFDVEDNKGNKKKDGSLNSDELINYMRYLNKSCKSLLDKVQKYRIADNISDFSQKSDLFTLDNIFFPEDFSKKDDKTKLKIQILNGIEKELQKHKDVKPNSIDLEYWTERIARNSEEYKIPCEIIIAIISRETNGKFTKNTYSKNGKGPMQITSAAVRSFLNGAKGNWHDKYEMLDPKLLHDIEMQLNKYGKNCSVENVLKECANDDNFGIKVGILVYKMKYAEAVDAHLHGKSTYATIGKTIAGLANGTIKLNATINEKCITNAAKNYNGSDLKIEYAKDVNDSIKKQNFDYRNLLINKTSDSNILPQGKK